MEDNENVTLIYFTDVIMIMERNRSTKKNITTYTSAAALVTSLSIVNLSIYQNFTLNLKDSSPFAKFKTKAKKQKEERHVLCCDTYA